MTKNDEVIGDFSLLQDKFGEFIPKAMVECKNKSTKSWKALCKEQLWYEAASIKDDKGQMKVIAVIGFKICFFLWDLYNYRDGMEEFDNFNAMNPGSYTEEHLAELDVKPVIDSITGKIRAIPWDLSNEDHHIYIEKMFLECST